MIFCYKEKIPNVLNNYGGTVYRRQYEEKFGS